MTEFLDLPAAATSDLQVGALLVLQDRRMVSITDVVRYSNLDAVERSFRLGVHHHSPLLGPIQFIAAVDEATGKHLSLAMAELAGARLLRAARRAA
jgi:hypothetical protein